MDGGCQMVLNMELRKTYESTICTLVLKTLRRKGSAGLSRMNQVCAPFQLNYRSQTNTFSQAANYITILGIQSPGQTTTTALRPVTYAHELIHLLTNYPLHNPPSSLHLTSIIVPPLSTPLSIPPFHKHTFPYPSSATPNSILLVIPTANAFKVRVLTAATTQKAPPNSKIHTLILPASSNVGEQPYNAAGLLGVYNRISNALRDLNSNLAHVSLFAEHNIGTVLVASIESYLQTDSLVDFVPTDFGTIVVHNATTGQTRACLSKGTTVDKRYVERARRFGYESGIEEFGRITAGEVMAAHMPGMDKANWHVVVAGRSRYDILEEGLEGLEFPF